MPVNLAYLATAYIVATLYYVAMSRSLGTPFFDSLTPEQKAIREQSAEKRRKIFLTGMVVGAGLLWWKKPFHKCA